MIGPDESETLRIFFDIPESRISADLAAALEGDVLDAIDKLDAFTSLPREQQTAEGQAYYYHNRMIQGATVRYHPNFDEDTAFFHMSLPAEQIADVACQVAFSQGRLKELNQLMHEVLQREGLADDEQWLLGESPEDYQRADAECEELLDQIHDTIFVHTLRQYGFDLIAELYERDHATFVVRREVGRRSSHTKREGDEELNRSIEENILQDYGPEALALLHERLRRLGL